MVFCVVGVVEVSRVCMLLDMFEMLSSLEW